MHGARGADKIFQVPPGTHVSRLEEVVFEEPLPPEPLKDWEVEKEKEEEEEVWLPPGAWPAAHIRGPSAIYLHESIHMRALDIST